MIGKSYDGTLANGAAGDRRRGPGDDRSDLGDLSPGTTTRARTGSRSRAATTIRRASSNTVTDPARRAYCAAVRRHSL